MTNFISVNLTCVIISRQLILLKVRGTSYTYDIKFTVFIQSNIVAINRIHKYSI